MTRASGLRAPAARVGRHGDAGSALDFPYLTALGLPREVPSRAADDAGRAAGASPRRPAWWRDGAGRGVAGRLRPGAGRRRAGLPDDEPGLGRALHEDLGLVTDAGGVASHPAVVAREFGIPAVVGTSTPRRRSRPGTACASTAPPAWSRSSRDRIARRPARAGQGRPPRADVSGAYAPGERLVETRIAQELDEPGAGARGAPRPRALRLRGARGLRSARVRAVSAAELLEAFPVRGALEALAARRRRRASERRLTASTPWSRRCAPRGTGTRSRSPTPTSPSTAPIVAAAGNATLARQWSLLEPFARTYLTV